MVQMVRVCQPPASAVVLTVACRCGGAILEVRAQDLTEAKEAS